MGLVLSLILAANSFSVGQLLQARLDEPIGTRINLDVDNQPIYFVLDQIEKQSGYVFIYTDNEIDIQKKVTLDMKERSLHKALDDVLLKNGIDYTVFNNQIVLSVRARHASKKVERDVTGSAVMGINSLRKLKLQVKHNLAQGRTITGSVVSNEDGGALPGVNVVIKGTAQGTITDMDGNYKIERVPDGASLVFSSVGFNTEEVLVGNQSVIDISMIPDITSLEEIVVIGYTTASKKDVASSISKISDKDIPGLAINDIRQTMQGKMAGVQVINDSGDPGAGARVIIRGVGSFSNPDPLYVIDGIQGGDINSVHPQDIESITVLKDASTTAIYGSAAANGVVLITTKRGSRGKPTISYDGSVGFAQFNRRYDMLNASDYVDLVDDIQAAGGLELTDKLRSPDVRIDRTDWQEEIFRNGLVTDHSLRLSGGSDAVSYSVSAGYVDQESTVIDRRFQRGTFGARVDENLGRFTLSQHLRIRYDRNKGALANFNDALRMPPCLPIYDPENLGGFSRTDKVTDLNDANNPFNEVYNTDRETNDLSFNLELSGQVDLWKGLNFKTQARISGGNYHLYRWRFPSNGGNFNRPTADIEETYNYRYNFLWENFFTYDNVFGDHAVNAVLGNTYSPGRNFREVRVGASDYTSTAIQNVALGNTTAVNGASVNSGKSRLSYFGRVGYTFKERYILNASVRRDASSVFGANNRWGTFSGFGGAWILTEEAFMAPVSGITSLKLRASWGKTGNDNIPAFLTTTTVWKGNSNNIVYNFGDTDTFFTGSTVNSAPNPDLKWEETTQWDVGFDIGFLEDRLNFVFDYFNRNNEDLLIQTQIPPSTGLGNPSEVPRQWVNAAALKNNGFEFTATYTDNSGDFTWDISLNTTYNINEVTALGTVGDLPINDGEFVAGIGNSTRTDLGQPLGAYYGYIVDHVAVDQSEVDALNEAANNSSGGEVTEYQAGLLPGDFIWRDVDGNGYINDDDRTFIGNPAPKWQYGGLLNARWKGFDAQVQFLGLADVDIVNGGRYWWEGMSKPFNNTTTVLRRWRQEGDVTDVPAAGQNSGRNLQFSTWYVESGDYFRVRNIILGYTLPSQIFANTLRNFRVYVALQNPITITNYSGYDPEVSTYAPDDNNVLIFERGIDRYQRPNPVVYRLGVQLSF